MTVFMTSSKAREREVQVEECSVYPSKQDLKLVGEGANVTSEDDVYRHGAFVLIKAVQQCMRWLGSRVGLVWR